MSSYEEQFFKDPWEYITQPTYPKVNRLFSEDERFFVSINEKNQKLFVVQVPLIVNADIPSELNSVDVEIVKFDENKTRLLCVLTDDKYIENFTLVIKDVAHRCKEYSDESLIGKSIDRLYAWTDLLKPSRKGITDTAQRGLWGEMFVLREYMSNVHPIKDAVRFWVGQDKKKQDFTLNHIALEVKTTMSSSTPTINISSTDQLERVTDRLYLIQIFMNKGNEPDAISLKDLYEEINELIGDDTETKASFLLDLTKIYGKATEKQINEKFVFLDYDLYEIDDNFPKISVEDMPDAIRGIKYQIERSKISELKLEEPIESIIKSG